MAAAPGRHAGNRLCCFSRWLLHKGSQVEIRSIRDGRPIVKSLRSRPQALTHGKCLCNSHRANGKRTRFERTGSCLSSSPCPSVAGMDVDRADERLVRSEASDVFDNADAYCR